MAFWKKIFKSKYTGAEIDAAVAKAGTVPAVTEADAGKALVVDEEGKIVPGEVSGGKAFILDLTQDATLFNAFVSLQTAGATALKSLTVPSALHPVVNETFADLISAIDNDITIPIYVICTAGQSRTYAPIIERIGDSGHYRIRFSYYWDNGSDSQYNEYTYVVDIIGFNTENEIVTVKCYTLFSTTGS